MCAYSTAFVCLAVLWPLVLPARAYRQDLRRRNDPLGWAWLLDPRLVLGGLIWSHQKQSALDREAGRTLTSSSKGGVSIGIYTQHYLWMICGGLAAWAAVSTLCPQ